MKKKSSIGLGIDPLMLSRDFGDHKFHIAAIRHDASYDAWDIYTCKKTLEDVDTSVKGYKDYVEHILEKQQKEKLSQKEFFKLNDRIFYFMCLDLSKSTSDRVQAWVLYKLVRLYRLI